MTDKEMNEIDICVSCGAETSYKKKDNISFRYGYIEGAGQLCFTCNSNELDIDNTGQMTLKPGRRDGLPYLSVITCST